MASRKRQKAANPPRTNESAAPSLQVLLLPLASTLVLSLISFLPRVQSNAVLTRSFWTAVVVLLVWEVALFLRLRAESARRFFQVQLRPQHYVQAACQFSVYAYWGYHWRPVYDYLWLLLAQLVFAYAFDMLLSWSRRESYLLGLGPFPIVFSTNLFLWFRDDWFYLQFLMIAVGFLGKEFVRWNRDGRRVHIFNPSAFTLALFSLVLIATNTTDLTWGQDIATTLSLAPHIYLFLFAVGLVVMYFFSITLVAGTAAAVLFGASALYSAVTGVPYFIDTEIPTAVFLGLHLLVTDPSTSPRTPPGKFVFGVMYGVGVFVLYALLTALGAPTFYDKLLSVPLLNLSVRWIDRFVASLPEKGAIRRSLSWANPVYMALWAVFFLLMTTVGSTDGRHRGDTVPFWEQACAEGRRNACERLMRIEASYCGDNSGWACNELGLHYTDGKIEKADSAVALGYFSRACELRFQAGCVNLLGPERHSRANPRALDLRLLLREGGPNLMDMPEPELYARACDHRWTFACGAFKGDKGKGPARVSGVSH